MAKRVIKYFNSPAYTDAQWTARNPLLGPGECGYLLESGLVTKMKIGPGYWNSLSYIALTEVYPYTDAITNPIGDVTTQQSNVAIKDIIKKMISPYVAPAVTTIVNNAGGSYGNERIIEIGLSLSGSVTVQFSLSNAQNLSGATPVNITAGGLFSNEGNFANASPIVLNLPAPYVPASPITRTINMVLTHVLGVTGNFSTTIVFKPKIMWFSSPLSAIPDGPTFMAQAGLQTRLALDTEGVYGFSANYSWIAIPVMILPGNPNFVDITNPNVPKEYAMTIQNQILIDNGVGSYNYRLFRSDFAQLTNTNLQIFEL